MSKRRRDKERDPSTKEKIFGYAKATAATIAGVAFFNRKGTEDFLAISKTVKNINSDLLGKKKNASNILDSLDKRIGRNGSIYKQTRDAQRTLNQNGTERIRINKTKGIFDSKGIAGAIKNSYEMKTNISYFRDQHHNKTRVKLTNKILSEYKIEDDKDIKIIQDIVKNAYHKVEKSDGLYKADGKLLKHEDFLTREINMLSDNPKKVIGSILSDVYSKRMEANKYVSDTEFINYAKKLAKAQSEKIMNVENLRNHYKTNETNRYSTMNKIIKNLTDSAVDVEEILTGSKKATIGEVFEEFKRFKNGEKTAFDFNSFTFDAKLEGEKSIKEINIFNALEEMEANNKGFLESIKDIEFGHNIRIKRNDNGTNHFFSSAPIDNHVDKALHWLSETIPGNLMKFMDIYQTNKTPYTAFFRGGTKDAMAYRELGNNSEELMNSYFYTGGQMTKIIGDGINMELVDVDMGDIRLISGEHGSFPRMFRDMLGSNNVIANASDNKILQLLDLDQSGVPNIFERVKAHLNKKDNPNWERNRLLKLQNLLNDSDLSNSNVSQKLEVADNLKLATTVFEEYTNLLSISDESLYKMLEGYKDSNGIKQSLSEESQRKIRMLLKGDIGDALYSKELFDQAEIGSKNYEDFIRILNSKSVRNEEMIDFSSSFSNSDLQNLISKYLRDSDSVDNLLNITTKTNKIAGLGIDITRTNVLDADDVFRREIIKDVLLSESNPVNGDASTLNIDRIFNFISELDIDENQKKSLIALNSWGVFNEKVLNTDIVDNVVGEADIILSNLVNYKQNSPFVIKNIHNNISHIMKENHVSGSKPYFGNLSENYINDYNKYMTVKKSALGDLLSDMNAEHFGKNLKKVGEELFAGRHDIEDMSLLTAIPYSMVSRLNYAVEDLGIGLSMDSSKSTLDLIKNMAIKRVLPAAAIISAYDYLDYESENITGTSITAAGARGLANIDLTARKIADKTGLGFLADNFKESSVIGEYLTGTTDYQSYDERIDWYNNGYSPVRSSRFWSFGSSSEFRGEGIAYWQPSYLKRAESNWREIGIYGSAEEKFKHSIIPSLRHPLSPINYLLDPYWLEKKNMDTRPYPYTGKMFTEGTPWGAILNPTIGELIKPVKMLPEIRERMGNGGVDLSDILSRMNARTLAKAKENDNVFVIEGTDIKNADYTPYAYATPGEVNFSFNGGISSGLQGVDWEEKIKDISSIRTERMPTLTTSKRPSQTNEEVTYSNAIHYSDESTSITDLVNMLKGMNMEVKNKSARLGSNLERQNGAVIFNNPAGNMLKATSNYYTEKYDPDMLYNKREPFELIDDGKIHDFISDAKYSMSQISGMYGFLGDLAFGENSYEYKLEGAGNMYSFNRGFWDASFGGLGSQFMEIARRFFPHEDRSRVNYNPLKNTMNSWLPERFLKGDAYASLPKGEMRLPGAGYESIYELHPDKFASDGYGAFDRMKILADIAPTSEEYKLWKKIAKTTIRDEDLIEEMKNIEYRAKKAGQNHDFYEYRYINNPTETSEDIVADILMDGTIKMGSGRKVKMAGIETTGEAVRTMLSSGDKVTLKTVANEAVDLDNDFIKAIVYKDDNRPLSADNISKTLVEQGLATKDRMDDSVLAPLATTGSVQEVLGAVQEIIGHAKIPFIHNKLLKIESPLESYKNEQIYGSSFQTWDNPIESFIKPQLNEQYRKGLLGELATIYGWKIFKKTIANDSYGKKMAASASLMAMNPTATLGAGIGFLTKMRFGKETMLGAEIGNMVGLAGWAVTKADNPIIAMSTFALGAYEMSRRLELDDLIQEGLSGKMTKGTIKSDVTEKAIKFLGKHAQEYNHKTAAVIGAGAGIALSILKNPDMQLSSMFGKWIPEDTEKKWELEEYFDRLEYVKYMGLYHEAKRRAQIFEGSNIGGIFAKLDENKKEIAKLQRKAKKIGNKYIPGTSRFDVEIQELNAQIEALEMPEQALKGGKYTKAAIAYKKMAESTVFGLSEAASYDEILRATPNQYKDYINAFAKEKNEKKRKEILKYASPQLKKILQISWKEDVDKQQSNASYFSYKRLPGLGWRGWKPSIDLRHVQMKTIENEGMLLSDFGFYNSEKAKASYEKAPDIDNYESTLSPFGLGSRANLLLALGGHGLGIENVSVETTSAPGLWIVGDITQQTSEVGNIANSFVNKTLSTLFL